MVLKEELKEYAKRCGADLVGISSMDRFEGAPKEMDPRYIFPDAKALIVMAFRIPRGYFRGIEEGTYFATYPSMGYGGINVIYAPIVLYQVCRFLEDEGYEAVPYPNMVWATSRDITYGRLREGWSRPVSKDRPAPDVFIHFRIAAFCAGLGEIGYSKLFLTPEFGPRQRFVAMLTDAPLEPDPIFEGKICDRCMLCAEECSAGAISKTETVKVEVASRELEWNKLDIAKCSYGYTGGIKETNPFLPEEIESDVGNDWRKLSPYPQCVGHNPATEGGRGCMRACMIHLEETGRIKNSFKNRFRKRKPWRL